MLLNDDEIKIDNSESPEESEMSNDTCVKRGKGDVSKSHPLYVITNTDEVEIKRECTLQEMYLLGLSVITVKQSGRVDQINSIASHDDDKNMRCVKTEESSTLDYNDLLKGSILDLILCPIDTSHTNARPCVHQCRVCPKIFLYTSALSRHERTHTDTLPYVGRLRDSRHVVVTESCSTGEVSGHLVANEPCSDGEDSDWEGCLSCTYCHTKFDTSRRLLTHVRQAHGKKKKKCLKCMKYFDDGVKHNCWVNAMLQNTDNEIAVNECSSISRDSPVQTEAKSLSISRSSVTRKQIRAVDEHITDIHNPDYENHLSEPSDCLANVKCCVCHDTFESEMILRNHYKSKHLNNTLSCLRCKYTTKDVRRFITHDRAYTSDLSYLCNECGLQYKSNSLLNKHMKSVHQGVKTSNRKYSQCVDGMRPSDTGESFYACEQCDRSSLSSSTLDTRIIYHQNKTSTGTHACALCGEDCRNSTKLKQHVIRHHRGECSFLCTVCGKNYSTNYLLKKHEVSHNVKNTDENRF